MTARERRLMSDYEQVRKDFAGHKNIIVTPVGNEPPEKYHITYFVNGIYLLPDGRIETQGRHEVEITLHADYPRYKPICKILTPIWHPNFRDGQICIGDIWGAGESLSDIIINIGDMIQYKSWNSYSPLSPMRLNGQWKTSICSRSEILTFILQITLLQKMKLKLIFSMGVATRLKIRLLRAKLPVKPHPMSVRFLHPLP